MRKTLILQRYNGIQEEKDVVGKLHLTLFFHSSAIDVNGMTPILLPDQGCREKSSQQSVQEFSFLLGRKLREKNDEHNVTFDPLLEDRVSSDAHWYRENEVSDSEKKSKKKRQSLSSAPSAQLNTKTSTTKSSAVKKTPVSGRKEKSAALSSSGTPFAKDSFTYGVSPSKNKKQSLSTLSHSATATSEPAKLRDTQMSVGFVKNRWPERKDFDQSREIYRLRLATEKKTKLLQEIEREIALSHSLSHTKKKKDSMAEIHSQYQQREKEKQEQEARALHAQVERQSAEVKSLELRLAKLRLQGALSLTPKKDNDTSKDKPATAKRELSISHTARSKSPRALTSSAKKNVERKKPSDQGTALYQRLLRDVEVQQQETQIRGRTKQQAHSPPTADREKEKNKKTRSVSRGRESESKGARTQYDKHDDRDNWTHSLHWLSSSAHKERPSTPLALSAKQTLPRFVKASIAESLEKDMKLKQHEKEKIKERRRESSAMRKKKEHEEIARNKLRESASARCLFDAHDNDFFQHRDREDDDSDRAYWKSDREFDAYDHYRCYPDDDEFLHENAFYEALQHRSRWQRNEPVPTQSEMESSENQNDLKKKPVASTEKVQEIERKPKSSPVTSAKDHDDARYAPVDRLSSVRIESDSEQERSRERQSVREMLSLSQRWIRERDRRPETISLVAKDASMSDRIRRENREPSIESERYADTLEEEEVSECAVPGFLQSMIIVSEKEAEHQASESEESEVDQITQDRDRSESSAEEPVEIQRERASTAPSPMFRPNNDSAFVEQDDIVFRQSQPRHSKNDLLFSANREFVNSSEDSEDRFEKDWRSRTRSALCNDLVTTGTASDVAVLSDEETVQCVVSPPAAVRAGMVSADSASSKAPQSAVSVEPPPVPAERPVPPSVAGTYMPEVIAVPVSTSGRVVHKSGADRIRAQLAKNRHFQSAPVQEEQVAKVDPPVAMEAVAVIDKAEKVESPMLPVEVVHMEAPEKVEETKIAETSKSVAETASFGETPSSTLVSTALSEHRKSMRSNDKIRKQFEKNRRFPSATRIEESFSIPTSSTANDVRTETSNKDMVLHDVAPDATDSVELNGSSSRIPTSVKRNIRSEWSKLDFALDKLQNRLESIPSESDKEQESVEQQIPLPPTVNIADSTIATAGDVESESLHNVPTPSDSSDDEKDFKALVDSVLRSSMKIKQSSTSKPFDEDREAFRKFLEEEDSEEDALRKSLLESDDDKSSTSDINHIEKMFSTKLGVSEWSNGDDSKK